MHAISLLLHWFTFKLQSSLVCVDGIVQALPVFADVKGVSFEQDVIPLNYMR